MAPVPPKSRCTERCAIEYVWYGGSGGREDIEGAVEALMGAIRAPQRRWNMYNESATRSEFRNRLQKAERGELAPVDHVKDLGRGTRAHLYEIRWQDITVHEQDDAGNTTFAELIVRLYHSEPPALPSLVIGLHAHEKVIVPDDETATRTLQNAEIDAAVQKFFNGLTENWGLS